MNRLANGRYSAVLRGDYIDHLDRICSDTTRDICIQNAILEYLALPDEVINRETARQRLQFVTWSGEPAPAYRTLVEQILIPDDLVGRLQPFDDYDDLDMNLNAAIRLWLQSREVIGLEP